MVAFLTSSPGGIVFEEGEMRACALDESNGFAEKLKQRWKRDSRCLLLSSDPEDAEGNDQVKEMMTRSFEDSGLSLASFDVCDRRDDAFSKERLQDYEVLILAGGHVPTENAFYEEIELREKLKGFQGVVIGISAGTMNSADTVYAQPELEGESVDEYYQKFLRGLGLTHVMVIPHYQEIKNRILDGKRMIEDIACPDSMGRRFYALVDGSYLLLEKGKTMLFGEAYLIENGSVKQVCSHGESLAIR